MPDAEQAVRPGIVRRQRPRPLQQGVPFPGIALEVGGDRPRPLGDLTERERQLQIGGLVAGIEGQRLARIAGGALQELRPVRLGCEIEGLDQGRPGGERQPLGPADPAGEPGGGPHLALLVERLGARQILRRSPRIEPEQQPDQQAEHGQAGARGTRPHAICSL
jgi:hypothetical protein